jgi:hypothetical protein
MPWGQLNRRTEHLKFAEQLLNPSQVARTSSKRCLQAGSKCKVSACTLKPRSSQLILQHLQAPCPEQLDYMSSAFMSSYQGGSAAALCLELGQAGAL